MQYRTRQEIYDIVKTHAQLQPGRSLIWNGDKCAYRGYSGTKCFVGALIADEDYKSEFDTRGVAGIAVSTNRDIREAARIAEVDKEFASDLQSVHDQIDPPYWLDVLRSIALENGLIA